MIEHINLPLILLAALATVASPGPATLAIAGTAMERGRAHSLALALGVLTGSFTWSISAALGLGALMMTHGWIMEGLRYLGAAYLAFLAFKSARSASRSGGLKTRTFSGSRASVYRKGLALHLTNPKAIFFFASLYTIGVPPEATPLEFVVVIAAVGAQSAVIFCSYAVLFSAPAVTRVYMRARRGFEAVFALGFGLASLKVLTSRL